MLTSIPAVALTALSSASSEQLFSWLRWARKKRRVPYRESGDGLGAADIGKMALIGKNPPFQICRVTAVTQHFFVMVRLDDDASGTVKQVHHALGNTAEVREIADTDILRLYFEADAARTVVRSRDRRDPEPRLDFRPGRIEEGALPVPSSVCLWSCRS